MGLGGYIFCEWDSVKKQYPEFQRAFADLESRIIEKCTADWFPTKTPEEAFGYLSPVSGQQFGRTSILPELFDDHNGVQMLGTFRQLFGTAGHQTLMTGTKAGNTIPKDFKIAWIGLAFPNKNQHITEIKFEIGERKYGRINLEDLFRFKKPALIFEEGLIIDEQQSFELEGYVEGPIPYDLGYIHGVYQYIIPLGACYYNVKDKVLGAPGSAI